MDHLTVIRFPGLYSRMVRRFGYDAETGKGLVKPLLTAGRSLRSLVVERFTWGATCCKGRLWGWRVWPFILFDEKDQIVP
ncbi:hypothetical protein WI642_11460 [Vibrio cholerae]